VGHIGQGAEIVKRAFGILAERLWKGGQLALFEIPVRAPHHYEGGGAHGKGAKRLPGKRDASKPGDLELGTLKHGQTVKVNGTPARLVGHASARQAVVQSMAAMRRCRGRTR